jgi:3D (Asp-Asp-Asp) domain-containing protein
MLKYIIAGIYLSLIAFSFFKPALAPEAEAALNPIEQPLPTPTSISTPTPTPTPTPEIQYPKKSSPIRSYKITITAYSSTEDQTDSTPFITAAGTYVRWGVIAANFLDFGTKIQIPELFGDQIFIVEDRLHERFNDRIDIWMPSTYQAKRFGVKKATIIILD